MTAQALHSRHADGASVSGCVQFIPRYMTDLERKVDAAPSVERVVET
jgi:hypothetical protein